MKTQAILNKKKNVQNISRFTTAMRMMSNIKLAALLKYKASFFETYETIYSILKHLHKTTTQVSDFTIHVIFATNQRFCKDFLQRIITHVNGMNFDQNDHIILIGKNIHYYFENRKNTSYYESVNTFAEIFLISKYIQRIMQTNKITNVKLHGYVKEKDEISAKSILPIIKSKNEKKFMNKSLIDSYLNNCIIENVNFESVETMYIAYEMYRMMIEHTLEETFIRVNATSSAADNIEKIQEEYQRLHNRIRQEEITNEMLIVSAGAGG